MYNICKQSKQSNWNSLKKLYILVFDCSPLLQLTVSINGLCFESSTKIVLFVQHLEYFSQFSRFFFYIIKFIKSILWIFLVNNLKRISDFNQGEITLCTENTVDTF